MAELNSRFATVSEEEIIEIQEITFVELLYTKTIIPLSIGE